jgi:hypothetical protein
VSHAVANEAKKCGEEGGENGGEHGGGHTPVTVCHREGNGSYHVITFDDDALSAHLAHGDIYPVPEGGCPQETAPECPNGDMNGAEEGCGSPATTEECPGGDMNGAEPGCGSTPGPGPNTTGTTPPGDQPAAVVLPASGESPAATPPADSNAVLGERISGGGTPSTPSGNKVAGVNAEGGNAPAAAAAPAAAQATVPAAEGTLPFTGTDAMLIALIGCLLLLAGFGFQRLADRRA